MRKALDEVHRFYRRDLVVYRPPQAPAQRRKDDLTWTSRS